MWDDPRFWWTLAGYIFVLAVGVSVGFAWGWSLRREKGESIDGLAMGTDRSSGI